MTGNERLLVLAAALRTNAANPTGAKFDLGTWMQYPADESPQINCGTVVCAVGLACILPELQAEGLSWVLNHVVEKGAKSMSVGHPVYDGLSSFDAVVEFFKMRLDDAEYLFYDTNYKKEGLPTIGAAAELAVAERIEKFVADRS